MMNGIAPGPLLVLLIIAVGGVILIGLIGRRQRRNGGAIIASLLLLMLLVAGFSLFFVRMTHTRAVAEYENAVAMRDQARHQQTTLRQAMATSGARPEALDAECESGTEDDEENYGYAEADGVDIEATVAELDSKVRNEVDALDNEIRATSGGGVVHVEVNTPRPVRPTIPVRVDTRRGKFNFPDRSTPTQLLTAILLAGVVLAGYFFLNANTRGHYTWRLRIGSTLVFAASLAVIVLISMR